MLSMFPLLTLDESTLFYWTLPDSNDLYHDAETQKKPSSINKWASAVDSFNPNSQVPPPTSTRVKINRPHDIPSLTTGTSSGRSYAPSVLSENVKIIVNAEPAPALSLYNNGGLSDNDEIKGEERDYAINSPPKGKKRINNEVFFFLNLIQ
jgi:hypothetical protein